MVIGPTELTAIDTGTELSPTSTILKSAQAGADDKRDGRSNEMTEFADIKITGRDKQRSVTSREEDELGLQVVLVDQRGY